MMWRIIGITLLAITFIGGWLMPEIYPDNYFKDGQSHAWGLKFMPPCKPFGVDVSCGFDPLLVVWIMVCSLMIVLDSTNSNSEPNGSTHNKDPY